MSDLKMYCVVSREALAKMNGNRGKLGAQTGHAFLHAWWNSMNNGYEDVALAYKNTQRAYKIVLACDTDAELLEFERLYEDVCGTAIIQDAGFTVFTEPTFTCIGIGPIDPDLREEKLAALRPLI